jgi:hypothetical protein
MQKGQFVRVKVFLMPAGRLQQQHVPVVIVE